jgi:hypothetical protein
LLQSDDWKGHPSTSRTEKKWTEVIRKCLVEDRTLSVRMLEEITRINRGKIHELLIENFRKERVFACFVPPLMH